MSIFRKWAYKDRARRKHQENMYKWRIKNKQLKEHKDANEDPCNGTEHQRVEEKTSEGVQGERQ